MFFLFFFLTKQETIGKGAQAKKLRRWVCCMSYSLGFYGDKIIFWVISVQLLWLRVLPGGAGIAQPRWIPARIHPLSTLITTACVSALTRELKNNKSRP